MQEDEEESQSMTSSNLTDYPMMSEDEAQKMIQTYNQTIEHMLNQNHQLKDKLDGFKGSLTEAQQKNTSLKEKYKIEEGRVDELNKIEKEICVELNNIMQQKSLMQYRSLIEKDIMKTQEEINQLNEEVINFEQFTSERKLPGPDIDNDALLMETLLQIKELTMMRAKLSILKNCQQCHKDFNPQTNQQDACLHHSGKIMFYSCKKCGADDYYTCCLKCQKCCEGCKYNFHVARP